MDARVYRHPEYPNPELWDLPGFGTPNFPKEKYLSAINIDTYDFFLLMTFARFYENDLWLAQEIISRSKRFYFLRKKIDFDLSNAKRDNKSHNTDTWLANTRAKCVEHLKAGKIQNPVVFLISSAFPRKFDFSALHERLIQDSPALKREAVALSLTVTSEKILKEKLEVLKSRIVGNAVLATLGSLIPIPFVGIEVNFAVMKKETDFYRTQLGLDDESLKRVANQVGDSLSILKNKLRLKSGNIFQSNDDFHSFCKEAHDQAMVDAIAKWIPIIGSIVSAIKTAPAAIAIQEKLLALCYEEACRVLKYQSEWLKKNADIF